MSVRLANVGGSRVAMRRGTVTVDSTRDVGSCFAMTLPRNRLGTAQPVPALAD